MGHFRNQPGCRVDLVLEACRLHARFKEAVGLPQREPDVEGCGCALQAVALGDGSALSGCLVRVDLSDFLRTIILTHREGLALRGFFVVPAGSDALLAVAFLALPNVAIAAGARDR